MKLESRAITVFLRGDEPKTIFADKATVYAAHPQTNNAGGWTVTHVPSGVAIWNVQQKDEALRCLQVLEEQQPLPKDASKFELFELPAAKLNEVRDMLTAIAPRWNALEQR